MDHVAQLRAVELTTITNNNGVGEGAVVGALYQRLEELKELLVSEDDLVDNRGLHDLHEKLPFPIFQVVGPKVLVAFAQVLEVLHLGLEKSDAILGDGFHTYFSFWQVEILNIVIGSCPFIHSA